MDLNISALTSKIEAMQGELVEIQSWIARRPVASSSIGEKSTECERETTRLAVGQMITITKSYAVETSIYEPGTDELHEGFTYEELLNMQR
ncbi:hypothetical protein Bca52824_065188 [Brassica carinata]|uniref:Uncharacterized protein n=1 Tax=Brassica carinata TaxID=52824 RepID=A0A8X7QMX2_BRACI|nr:hypothetical protein Bca52824_065188 [Brassica carinata]